jgi:hypothetical protein
MSVENIYINIYTAHYLKYGFKDELSEFQMIPLINNNKDQILQCVLKIKDIKKVIDEA